MMISFCRKSVHSFLGFAAAADSLQPKSPWKSHHVNAAAEDGLLPNGLGLAGLGLITAVCSEDVMQRSPNVLESSSVKSASPPPSPLPPPKKDPGGIGFIDDIGGGVDGLMSCTESLGFESSDERLVNDASQMLEDNTEGFGYGGGGGGCSVRARRRRVVVKKFPPPLSSLNQHGHPNFYLRPVRKDGRLELTEIRIERPEILRASREDGRLRLHLIKDDEQDKNENHHEEEEEEAEEEAITEEPEEESITEEPEEEEEEEEVESFVNEGKMGNNPVNGEGYRRCIEVVNHQRRREHHHHHHHHMDVWRQHCVTTS